MKDEKQQKTDCLKVRMLGGFSMEYRGLPVWEERNGKHSRVLQLLQILLYAGSKGITREQLLFRLYGRETSKDLSNNLRVTLCHLRKKLRESKLPGEDLIHIRDGRYFFASTILVEMDVWEFSALCRAAKKVQGSERLTLLKKACGMYRGYFLPEWSGEEWVAVEEAHYQRLYLQCMEEMCGILYARGAYEEVLWWSSQAARLYPYEEWQIWQMDALVLLGREEEAAVLYAKTTKQYFRELALYPSERMLDCFRRMSGTIRMAEGDFQMIQEKLQEKEGIPGAYCCTYPGFVDSYRTAARLMKCFGQEAYLLLCTVLDERKRHPGAYRDGQELSGILEEALQEALDHEEVYTRYNKSQFLAILPYGQKGECQKKIARIDAGFRRRVKSRRVRIHYRMRSMVDDT